MTGIVEYAVCFCAGETLVPQMDGEFQALAQFFGEGSYFFRLETGVAGHVQRVAYHDL